MGLNRGKILSKAGKAIGWTERHLPRGVRSAAGLLCLIGGVLGFLPILGFWMIPLGAAFIALDVPPLRRRMHGWFERRGIDIGAPEVR